MRKAEMTQIAFYIFSEYFPFFHPSIFSTHKVLSLQLLFEALTPDFEVCEQLKNRI